MTTTTYYDLNIVEGTDIVNPLTVDNPNYETIDEVMHENAVAGVTLATEIANATVHAIIRENSECSVIRFIATSEWKAGDTVTVDGVPVTALLPSGETLPDGAYVINANVLCILTGTNLTVYAERKKTDNANEIAYNETTVAAELTALNNSLEILTTRPHQVAVHGTPNTSLTFEQYLTLPKGVYLLFAKLGEINPSNIKRLNLIDRTNNVALSSSNYSNSILYIADITEDNTKIGVYTEFIASETVDNNPRYNNLSAIRLM